MSLWNKLKGEFIDIVEWLDDSKDTLVHRFRRHDNEIKYKAQLIVRPGQAAVFVNEGQVADVFEPGRYELITENLPILTKLKGWKYGFESPFKAEVYFVSTRQFTDLKWGTKNPIMLRDAEFGPVRLRAFGTYAVRVSDPARFVHEITGTNAHFRIDDIYNQLRNLIVARFTDVLGESNIPVLDLAANYDELSTFVTGKIAPDFEQYGIEVTTVLVENISLPPEVERALDKRTSMGIVGDLSAYTRFQAAEAMEKAAQTPGSGAGEGMGMGMGFAMAKQMGEAMAGPPAEQAPRAQPSGPPPLPQTAYYVGQGGQQTGPFDLPTLRGRIADGSLTRETLVWKQGMDGWKAAGEVDDLAPHFAATPPPLPNDE